MRVSPSFRSAAFFVSKIRYRYPILDILRSEDAVPTSADSPFPVAPYFSDPEILEDYYNFIKMIDEASKYNDNIAFA
nr:hypothetical protein CFP56_31345 [Quercus suber]